MSRSIWLMALLASAFAAAGASACPGTMAIGLPLLFGSDEPASPWPTPMPQHVVIDLKLPADFEERQEPLAQKELAQECLKVWRDLVRDGRFEIAPIVAAKAAALDPTNLDAQYAVIVSQVLRSIGERQPQVVHSTKAPLCNTACCEADICPACPSQCTANCPVDVKIARQIEVRTQVSGLPRFSSTTPGNDLNPIVDQTLKHLFPRGLLASDAPTAAREPMACATAPAQVNSTCPYPDHVIAARDLPATCSAPSRDELKMIPLTSLSQPAPDRYRLAPGDVLGIFIDGVLGEKDQSAAVHVLNNPDFPPSVGVPILVREDGTIVLPSSDPKSPFKVQGRSLLETEEMIRAAYGKMKIITAESRVLVTLMSPRMYAVQVVRQECVVTPNGRQTRSAGFPLHLPAYKNDVLNALNRTGGLPGPDSLDEVSVQRRLPDGETKVMRIPLRVRAGEALPFRPSDVILQTGDVVFIGGRETEVYYMGGNVSPRQMPMPRDYDLRVTQAVALQSGLSGNVATSVASHAMVVRRTKENAQIKIHVDLKRALNDPREDLIVQPGDFIIMADRMTSNEPNASASCDSPKCEAPIQALGVNSNGGLQGVVQAASHEIATSKRVTIKTATYQIECDRVALNEREMALEGNVNVSLRQKEHDICLQANRIRATLADGDMKEIYLEGKVEVRTRNGPRETIVRGDLIRLNVADGSLAGFVNKAASDGK